VDVVEVAPAKAPGLRRTVVLSLGPNSTTDLPMPQDLRPGDRLRIYVELELTTDYESSADKGLIGNPYSYAPLVQAVLLLAADERATAEEPGRAHSIQKTPVIPCSHERHHQVITFAAAEYTVPETGVPWSRPVFVNVALSAAHPSAKPGDVVLVGENEPEPRVDQDTGGIRVIRLRPGDQPEVPAKREQRLRRRAGVPVTKRATVIFSKKLEGLAKDEQLFVHGRLLTDGKRTGFTTRISTELLLADDHTQTDPGQEAKQIATWSGHLSKQNGFNCLPKAGPQRSEKFGVLRVRRDATKVLHVNLIATSAAPFQTPPETGDDFPVEEGSFLDVVRYSAELIG
jgi:hypothetical protein